MWDPSSCVCVCVCVCVFVSAWVFVLRHGCAGVDGAGRGAAKSPGKVCCAFICMVSETPYPPMILILRRKTNLCLIHFTFVTSLSSLPSALRSTISKETVAAHSHSSWTVLSCVSSCWGHLTTNCLLASVSNSASPIASRTI